MYKFSAKPVLFLISLFVMGCASYKVPIQMQNHPASSDAEVSQIELSPILDLIETTPTQKQESHDQHHHH